ncbi:hypothetical protein HK104_003894 [Borealophlyctis nickersoniae]|nr:hypothetical protein HK104_003894 [Borealophlyctis nickersoniae]
MIDILGTKARKPPKQRPIKGRKSLEPSRAIVEPPETHLFDVPCPNFDDFLEIQQFVHRFSAHFDYISDALPALTSYTFSNRTCVTVAHSLLTFLLDDSTTGNPPRIKRDVMWPFIAPYVKPSPTDAILDVDWDEVLRALASSKSHRTVDLMPPQVQIVILRCLVTAVLESKYFQRILEAEMEEHAQAVKEAREEEREYRKCEREARRVFREREAELVVVDVENVGGGRKAGLKKDGKAPSAVQKLREEFKAESAARQEEFGKRQRKLWKKVAKTQPRSTTLGLDHKGNTYWGFDSDPDSVLGFGRRWWLPDEGKRDEAPCWFYFSRSDVGRFIGFLECVLGDLRDCDEKEVAKTLVGNLATLAKGGEEWEDRK